MVCTHPLHQRFKGHVQHLLDLVVSLPTVQLRSNTACCWSGNFNSWDRQVRTSSIATTHHCCSWDLLVQTYDTCGCAGFCCVHFWYPCSTCHTAFLDRGGDRQTVCNSCIPGDSAQLSDQQLRMYPSLHHFKRCPRHLFNLH